MWITEKKGKIQVKIYGPYYRKDGRQHVIIIDGTKRRTVSYPKYLMEQRLGRKLDLSETVDHINRDFTNNDPSNLQILERKKHAALDVRRVMPVIVKCIHCGKEMKRSHKDAYRNALKGKAGPFCKSCAGRYGANLQNRKCRKLEAQIVPKNRCYYSNK